MSGGYTPLFGSMFKGSMAGRWPDTGIWCALLAMADRNGEIDCTPEYISLVTGCPVADVEAVIARLCAPDPKSRSQIEEGRRLLPIPNRGFGWIVVNHGRYREKARLMTRDAERTATGADAERKRASRDKSPDVPRCPPPSPSPDADKDNEETRLRSNVGGHPTLTLTPPDEVPLKRDGAVVRIFGHWQTVHRHPQAKLDTKRRRLIQARLKDYSEAELIEAINGYRHSEFHNGVNDRHQRYDGLEVMLRDAAHVDRGRALHANPASGRVNGNGIATDPHAGYHGNVL